MREDPEFRAEVEQSQAEHADRVRRKREADQPVLQDLAAAGVVTDSVWDLHKMPDALPRAIPVLIDHLRREHPTSAVDSVGTALATPASRPWWAELKAIYLATGDDTVRDRVAAALSRCATKVHYDDLLTFLRSEALGASRIYFLRPVNRIGNRISPGVGRDVIASFANDPILGKEAAAILAGRGPND